MSSIGGVGSGTNPLQQAMRQLFSKSDANADGKLDTGEISSLLDTLQTGTSDSSLTSDSVVSAFDADGDGAVSGSEFDAGFKKLGEQMQSTMIAMQEGAGQMPPPGPPPGMSGDMASDDDEDDTTTTVSDLLALLESYSSEDTASTDDSTTTSTDTLLQTFLSQLEQYAKAQEGYQSQYSSSVSLSA